MNVTLLEIQMDTVKDFNMKTETAVSTRILSKFSLASVALKENFGKMSFESGTLIKTAISNHFCHIQQKPLLYYITIIRGLRKF